MIAWSGHIAKVADWGEGRTEAVSGSGAQFHMRVEQGGSFTSGLGNEELPLQAIGRPSLTTGVTIQTPDRGHGSVLEVTRCSTRRI